MLHARALITAPNVDVVSLAEAKAHLRVDVADEDARVAACIAAAVSELDPAGGGWLGRALRPQVWEYRLSEFPRCSARSGLARYPAIELPYPPLIAVVSVKYTDTAGVEQTLVENTDFRVFGKDGFGKVSLEPVYGKSWPSARAEPESVRIRYNAGYEAGPPDKLPPPIRAWVLLRLAALYEHREAVVIGAEPRVNPIADRLLDTFRVY